MKMNIMKKIFASFVAILAVVCTVACNNSFGEDYFKITDSDSLDEFLGGGSFTKAYFADDVELSYARTIKRDGLVINLNNKTLSVTNTNQIYIGEKANVEIINGTIKNIQNTEGKYDYTKGGSFILNKGTLILENVNMEFNAASGQTGADGVNDNTVYGVRNLNTLTIGNSSISLIVGENENVRPCGIQNLGELIELNNSTLTVSYDNKTAPRGVYGIYNYIHSEGEPEGTYKGNRKSIIDNSTIKINSKGIDNISAVYSESYMKEYSSEVIIKSGTRVNVTRQNENGTAANISYCLRAKGNACISGAMNARLSINDNSNCNKYQTSAEANTFKAADGSEYKIYGVIK